MTPALRKRHRQIWSLLAVLLPAAFIGAVWVLPAPVVDRGFNPAQPRPYAEVIAGHSSGQLSAWLRRDGNLPGWQLELKLKQHLPAASVQLYLAANGQRERLLGSLQGPGTYFFHFPPEAVPSTEEMELQLYDGIKDRGVGSLTLRRNDAPLNQ